MHTSELVIIKIVFSTTKLYRICSPNVLHSSLLKNKVNEIQVDNNLFSQKFGLFYRSLTYNFTKKYKPTKY